MQPDFRVLDAYLDLWQQVALGRGVDTAFVDGLLEFAPYQPSLWRYRTEYGIESVELRSLLLSLGGSASYHGRPELQAFWQANRWAIQQIGYCFDIIFPLRRLSLQHVLWQAGLAPAAVPCWLRMQPELAEKPYLVSDALVVDFFSLRIDPSGHLTIGGKPIAEFVVAALVK